MVYNVMNIPRIIIHHGTILFMISFSALSAVNVILLSRSLSSKVILTPETYDIFVLFVQRRRNSAIAAKLHGIFLSIICVALWQGYELVI